MDKCHCCGSKEFYEVTNFSKIPLSGVFRVSRQDPQHATDLFFEACVHCDLLRRTNVVSFPNYTQKPRPTDRQMPSYSYDLLASIDQLVGKEAALVEIGSNDGAFLKLLETNGHRNIIGIEPSIALAESSRRKGLRVETGYFDKQTVKNVLQKYGSASMVVCRHTLEHVPNPGDFIGSIRELLSPKGGFVLIEVPDSSALSEGLNFVELWDEHLHYFTANTLGQILQNHGFNLIVSKTYPHLETRNLLAIAMLTDITIHGRPNRSSDIEDWQAFSARFEGLSQKLVTRIKNLPRPVYIIGASHPQCNFINYLELGANIDFMIDDDLEKVGKHPPIRDGEISIMTTSTFGNCPPLGSLVLTGFGYPAWSRRIIEIATAKNMQIFDPRVCVD